MAMIKYHAVPMIMFFFCLWSSRSSFDDDDDDVFKKNKTRKTNWTKQIKWFESEFSLKQNEKKITIHFISI